MNAETPRRCGAPTEDPTLHDNMEFSHVELLMLGILALVQLRTRDLDRRLRSTSIMCSGEEGRASKWCIYEDEEQKRTDALFLNLNISLRCSHQSLRGSQPAVKLRCSERLNFTAG
jgi:hypothetical protein